MTFTWRTLVADVLKMRGVEKASAYGVGHGEVLIITLGGDQSEIVKHIERFRPAAVQCTLVVTATLREYGVGITRAAFQREAFHRDRGR